MAYDVDVPLIEVLQHPRVCIRPARLVATNVSIHDVDLRHTHCQPAQVEQKNYLWVYSVAAGSAIKDVPRQEGKLVLHWLEQALEIKGRIETMQLTPVEASHLQSICVGEVGPLHGQTEEACPPAPVGCQRGCH
jgi:hypothetical protein